ncbi:efflux RND transporter permease subunit [Ectobacillus sp. sgz5001026]|uniref:efflux RND transporter permease subunit n=1 Tax=Ectobacillus sp. sgz5001026 TaxID=3242473 RepID=UPI0036D3166E
MSIFTKWSFGNKAAVLIMTLVIFVLGIVSYRTMPMELFPSANFPQISVVVMGQGLNSSSMEKQVAEPIERAVTTVPGKTNTYSTIGDGFTKIDITFNSKTKLDKAKQDVQDALGSVTLPANVSKPNIVLLNTSMIPIVDVAFTFDEGLTPANVELAKKSILPMFQDVKGVASVQASGITDSYVSIKLDPEKLQQKQVSMESVITSLQGQNVAVTLGEKNIDGKTGNLQVIGNVKNITDLKQLQVAPNVKLEDISTIDIKKAENVVTHVNGKEALLFVVTKDGQSNAVSVSQDIEKVTKQVNDKYSNVHAEILLALGNTVKSSVTSMMNEVLLGALFATIVIMLFLRSIRTTFITIISIPLSLCFTLFLLSRSGITLNILTLGGVAVAVGRLVDDSIVVIENIFRRMQTEKFSSSLILDAVKEVGTAITSSTLTTVAVFLPIGLVSGGLQDLVLPFALTVTYSLLSSLLVALTVVPLMSSSLLKNAKIREHKPAVRFSKFLTWSLNHKWLILITSLLLFFGSIGTYIAMPKGAISKEKADTVSVMLSYPNNTPIDEVKKHAADLENYISKQDQVKISSLQIGNSNDAAKYGNVGSPTSARFFIFLKNEKDLDSFTEEIKKQSVNYPGATFTAQASSMLSNAPTSITVDVTGEKLEDLQTVAKKIEEKAKTIDGVKAAKTNQDENKTVYSFEINQSVANVQQVSRQLGVMLNTTPLGTVTVDNKETAVQLEPIIDPKSKDDLTKIPVTTATGMTPISKLAELKQEDKPTSIFHKDGNQFIRVTAEVDPAKLSSISTSLNAFINGDKNTKALSLPENTKVYVGGASAQQSDDFSDLFMAMLASICLVFIIMVVTFKSLRAPIAILFSLPLAAIGAILGLLISGIPVDQTSLLGALMLIGIVVTNAIVLLDRVKHNEQTMTIRDAIVEAASTRMRPILMTAFATIGAMVPLLFKQAESASLVSQGLAIVVIGGLAVATLLTLVVIPVVYELFHFRKAKKQRQKKANSSEISA